jgi:Uma2 family endonuclease
MVQSNLQPVTFDEFIEWYPRNSEFRYELHDGAIIQMPKPTGKHSKVAGFLVKKLNGASDLAERPYFIPKECVVKPEGDQSGYEPEAILLNEETLTDEPRWEKDSTIMYGKSVVLIVEVVSTNWRDDYHKKFADYEAMGIPEYWVIDFVPYGASRFTGHPKQPTIWVYQLNSDGESIGKAFREDDRIEFQTFPNLQLTAAQIFNSANPCSIQNS